jgi:hypothetical protein
MVDYDNNFVWIVKITDILSDIEKNNNIQINNENYLKILENLDKYIQIDDVIFNTNLHPFLFNFVKGAVENPQKEFNTIFSEILSKEDLEKFGINSENFCQTKEEFHNGFAKFFKNSEEKIHKLLHEKFPDFNENLHFVDYKDLLTHLEKTFDKFNKDQENFDKLKARFSKRIEDFICEGCFDLSFKMDVLKPLIGAEAGKFKDEENQKNILFIDYDFEKLFNLEIKDQTSEFPKFLIMNPSLKEDGSSFPFYPNLIGSLIYFPKSCEKLISMFFEHSLQTTDQNYPLQMQLYPEKRFEIFFEYLTNKGFKSNEEMLNFLNSKTYQELYKEYDEYYQDFFKIKNLGEMYERYIKAHFDFENYDINKVTNDFQNGCMESMNKKNPMHFIDQDGNVMKNWTSEIVKENKRLQSIVSTWLISSDDVAKISQKNNIFDQIKAGLSFI